MSIYTGINDFTKNTSSLYLGVGGKSKRIVKGYIGIDGQAKLFYIRRIHYAYLNDNIRGIKRICTTNGVQSGTLVNTSTSEYNIYKNTNGFLFTTADIIILNKNCNNFTNSTAQQVDINNLDFSLSENLSYFGCKNLYGKITNKNFNNVQNICWGFNNTKITGIVPKMPNCRYYQNAFEKCQYINSIENDFFISDSNYSFTFYNCNKLTLLDNYKIKSNNSIFNKTFLNCNNINNNIILNISNSDINQMFLWCNNVKEYLGILDNISSAYYCFRGPDIYTEIKFNLIMKSSIFSNAFITINPIGNLYMDITTNWSTSPMINKKIGGNSLNIYIKNSFTNYSFLFNGSFMKSAFYDYSSGNPELKNYYVDSHNNIYIYENYWPQNEVDAILELAN